MIFSFIISIISVAIVSYINYVKHINIPLTIYAGGFWLWIIFFVLGIYIRKYSPQLNIKIIITAIILSLILQIIETYIYKTYYSGGGGIKPSSFIFSIFVILLLFSERFQELYNKKIFINKVITYIGRNSFNIYLTHCIIIQVTYKYLPTNWAVKTIIILFINLFAIYITKRIIPYKIQKYFGL